MYQVLEAAEAEQQEYQQRNPGVSMAFTACVFILFLIVMHHTMVVADGEDGYPMMPPMPPMPPPTDQGEIVRRELAYYG